jgi:hypothetical protein
MNKLITSLLLFMVALAGCTDTDLIEDRLMQEVNQRCSSPTQSGCTIVLKQLTPFAWDKVYFFSSWTTAESIREVIGFGYPGEAVEDDYTRILFTKGTAVVHEEDYHKIDYHSSAISIAGIADSLSQAKTPFLTPDNALLLAQKDKVEEGGCTDCYYYSFSVKN